MHATELKNLLGRFVSYATEPGEKSDEALLELCDRILCAYHDIRFTFDEREYPEAPRNEPPERRSTIGALFPSYGFYSLAASLSEEFESGALIGDAIDDLADITRDFEEVLWRFEHTSPDDALWHFHFGHGTHWGHHIRSLQLFLFRRLSGT